MELIELWEGEECLYDNNVDARQITAFTFMLTTTRMIHFKYWRSKLSQLSIVLLQYKPICDTCRLRNLTLPIMCKGMYDFLDDFCRTENRQENRMCKQGLRFALWTQISFLSEIFLRSHEPSWSSLRLLKFCYEPKYQINLNHW